jgi:hypothetical protein
MRSDAFLIAERVYRFLLLAYPASHRREYGPLMLQCFRDLCRDACQQGGTAGLLRLAGRILADTAVSAVNEHLYVLQERSQIMTKKQHAVLAVCVGFPLWLGVLLFLINPGYAGRLLTKNSAQPIGWLMSAAVVAAVCMAYLIQRRIITRVQTRDTSAQPVSGIGPRIAWTIVLGPFRSIALNGHPQEGLAFAISTLLLVWPAMLLVLLGPAYVTVNMFLQK